MKRWPFQLLLSHRSIFLHLLTIDLILVFLHLSYGHTNWLLHLDMEQNIPTYYQSFKLIIFGTCFLFIGVFTKVKSEVKTFLIPLAMILVLLGFDELLQIHENIYKIFEYFPWFHPSKIVDASMKMGYRSSLWILYYLPFIILFVFWSGYWLRYFQAKMKSNYHLIFISSICLFAVLLMEILGSTGTYDDNTYFLMVAIEETAEMLFATTLVLVGSKISSRLL